MEETLRARLAAAVGDQHVLCDPSLTAGYERDITGRFGGRAAAVVRPAIRSPRRSRSARA